MLSIFPSLLVYGMRGAALLRLTVGLIFFLHGSRNIRSLKGNYGAEKFRTATAVVEILSGVFLIIGLFTQVAALVAVVESILAIFIHKQSTSSFNRTLFYLLLAGTSAAILFIGPGTFAFDLPL